jgi:excinuclease ABC subunit C
MSENNLTKELRLYPHFKLTDEKFPRLLATRKIADDKAEYFGAFLPETGVRFWIDFLNKTFRLRACEIEIDGSFDVPCPQFYRKRCVAPCVRSLCDEKTYQEQVELLRLFLTRKISELEKYYLAKIQAAAENLDFEKAKDWRDLWLSIEKILTEREWNYWLDDAIDTFEIEKQKDYFLIHFVTMRARKTLGRRTFVFENKGKIEEVIPKLLRSFYRFYSPKEIRVSHDFAERLKLADELSKRFRRKIAVNLIDKNKPKILTERAIEYAKFDREFRQIKRAQSLAKIQSELIKDFKLKNKSRKIEAFDVAHISGNDFVAAKSVWKDGKLIGKESEFWFSEEISELDTLRKFLDLCLSKERKNLPDMILIDGGKSHLQAGIQSLENFSKRNFIIISAVKPPGQHGAISRFLIETGDEISFNAEKTSHLILQKLRDEAHNLSNEIHRQRREFSHFYELARILPSIDESERLALLKKSGSIKNILELSDQNLAEYLSAEKFLSVKKDLENYRLGKSRKVEPFIVPLRFSDEDGDAEDLRPLKTYKI